MTRKMVLKLLATANTDLEVCEYSNGLEIDVTVIDFDGFDENWCEILRELDNAELVKSIYNQLETSAISVSGRFYTHFEFDGFTVTWGYASFDI